MKILDVYNWYTCIFNMYIEGLLNYLIILDLIACRSQPAIKKTKGVFNLLNQKFTSYHIV